MTAAARVAVPRAPLATSTWAAARALTFAAAGVGVVLAVGLAALPHEAASFATVALAVLLAEAVGVGRSLHAEPRNHPLGAATLLTLARGLALAALAGLAALPPRSGAAAWLPFALYGFNAVADGVDGWLARVRGTASVLGARLDTAFDALGLLVGPAVAVAHGRLPAFYLAVGVAYYVMVGAAALRRALGGAVYPERNVPSPHRRLWAGLHMGLVTAALAPPASPAVAAVAAAVFAPPLVVDLVTTIPVTLGWLGPAPYARLARAAAVLTREAAPLVARAASLPAAVLAHDLPVAARVLAAATALGTGARTCAVGALLVAAAGRPPALDVAATSLVAAAAVVGYFGPGPVSPVRLDDRLMLRRPEGRP